MFFFDDGDRQTYLDLLSGYACKHGQQVWAYCLVEKKMATIPC